MKQYLDLLKAIKETGDYKEPARENMPGTYSLFGYQFRHNLEDGFPALTTKKLYWKGVVIELLWFLSGNTNIKFLDNYGVRKMWHQDAYNYYVKIASRNDAEAQNYIMQENPDGSYRMFTFEEFCDIIKEYHETDLPYYEFAEGTYILGDCGMQYGKLWRDWRGAKYQKVDVLSSEEEVDLVENYIDQIKELINGLKTNPTGRRHIITAWNPATLNDMALNACHCMAQWNCRPISNRERMFICKDKHKEFPNDNNWETFNKWADENNIPKYKLDCQMYQRSADVFLGVPLNIASYALFTHMLAKMCNMLPGDMIYTYGDVHIYEDHLDAIEEQIKREPTKLPTLNLEGAGELDNKFWSNPDLDALVDDLIKYWDYAFILEDYNPQKTITANLSTGMKK